MSWDWSAIGEGIIEPFLAYGAACRRGSEGAETITEPFQSVIAFILGVDDVGEAAIPLLGCGFGMGSEYTIEYNFLEGVPKASP